MPSVTAYNTPSSEAENRATVIFLQKNAEISRKNLFWFVYSFIHL